MIALELKGYLEQIDELAISGESGHYVYSHGSIIKLFLYGTH